MGHLQEDSLFYSFPPEEDLGSKSLDLVSFLPCAPKRLICIVPEALRNIQRLFLVQSLKNYKCWQEFISTVLNRLLKSVSLISMYLFSATPSLHISFSKRSQSFQEKDHGRVPQRLSPLFICRDLADIFQALYIFHVFLSTQEKEILTSQFNIFSIFSVSLSCIIRLKQFLIV